MKTRISLHAVSKEELERNTKLFPERDPKGPDEGFQRIQRGGSYLCHKSYCDRYQVHSRIPSDPTNSAGHSGFRVASDR